MKTRKSEILRFRYFCIFSIALLLYCISPTICDICGVARANVSENAENVENNAVEKDDEIKKSNIFDVYKIESELEPKLFLTKPNGDIVTLKKFRQNFLVLYFYASWCNSCVEELKQLNELKAEMTFLDINDFQILPISIDFKTVDHVQSLFAEHALENLEIYLDKNKAAMSKLGVKSMPTTIFVDAQGYVIARMEKNINWIRSKDQLMDFISAAKQEQADDRKKSYQQRNNNDIIFNKEKDQKVMIIN